MIVFDTNLLIYAHRSQVPEHRAALHALEEGVNNPAGWGIALPCIEEFLAVVTHPSASGRPSTAAEAEGFLSRFLADAQGAVLHPGPDVARRLLATAAEFDVRGPRLFDLQIALVARDHGAEVSRTHDRDFVCLPGIEVHDPLA